MIGLVVVIVLGSLAVCMAHMIGDALEDAWAPGAWEQWRRQHEQHQNDARSRAGRDA